MAVNIPSDQDAASEKRYAWVYLLNLGFYFIPLMLSDYHPWQIGLSLLTLVPFVFFYYRAFNADRQNALLPIVGMLLLAILITPINTGSLSLFTFAGFFIGFFYSTSVALFSLIGISMTLLALNQLFGFDQYYFPAYGTLIVAVVGLFGVIEKRRLESKRLQQKSKDEIAQMAKMVERERIARDLHDVMGHSLSSIILKAELAEKLIEKQEISQASQQLAELGTIARDSLSQIRRTVSNYKHTGLDATIQQLCQRLRDKEIAVEVTGELQPLPARIESQLILILTELVSNILRHSQAKNCQIILDQQPDKAELSVIEQVKLDTLKAGNGIQGIKERVASLNGQYMVKLTPNYHTQITIPLQ